MLYCFVGGVGRTGGIYDQIGYAWAVNKGLC
jgi:hypothetical protein